MVRRSCVEGVGNKVLLDWLFSVVSLVYFAPPVLEPVYRYGSDRVDCVTPGVNRYLRGKSLQCESSDFEVTSRNDFF